MKDHGKLYKARIMEERKMERLRGKGIRSSLLIFLDLKARCRNHAGSFFWMSNICPPWYLASS